MCVCVCEGEHVCVCVAHNAEGGKHGRARGPSPASAFTKQSWTSPFTLVSVCSPLPSGGATPASQSCLK